jgi:hypothetical protein
MGLWWLISHYVCTLIARTRRCSHDELQQSKEQQSENYADHKPHQRVIKSDEEKEQHPGKTAHTPTTTRTVTSISIPHHMFFLSRARKGCETPHPVVYLHLFSNTYSYLLLNNITDSNFFVKSDGSHSFSSLIYITLARAFPNLQHFLISLPGIDIVASHDITHLKHRHFLPMAFNDTAPTFITCGL